MEKSVVLGIRMDSKTRDSWHEIARLLGVPTNRMLLFIVKSWSTEHFEQISNFNNRERLSEIIERSYFEGKLG
jgi:hypothetical protein